MGSDQTRPRFSFPGGLTKAELRVDINILGAFEAKYIGRTMPQNIL